MTVFIYYFETAIAIAILLLSPAIALRITQLQLFRETKGLFQLWKVLAILVGIATTIEAGMFCFRFRSDIKWSAIGFIILMWMGLHFELLNSKSRTQLTNKAEKDENESPRN